MKLLVLIASSFVLSALAAAALFRYVVAFMGVPGFWHTDPLAMIWAGAGGVGGIVVVVYALFAILLVTGSAYVDLAGARTRLARSPDAPGERPEQRWQGVFAGTGFTTIAAQLSAYEMGVAPLALLRVLRREIWRVTAKRLATAETVTLGLAAIAVALGPAATPAVELPGRWYALAAIVAAAAAMVIWLALDNAINRLAMAMARRSSWDVPPVATETRLVSYAGEGAIEPQSLARLETVLREAADQQRNAFDRMGRGMAAQSEDLIRRLDRARAADADVGALAEALTQLGVAVDKLADPVMRRIQLLGANDRRLLTALRRQEEVVGTVANRWSELVAALQGMSAGLENLAQITAQRGPEAPPHPAGELTEELQDLLDEMSEDHKTR